MTEPRIYVASLSDYNAGTLHGVWIDATQEPDDILAEVQAMLAESPTAKAEGSTAEEWAIHDHEGFEGLEIDEHATFEEVSELAQAIAEHGAAYAAYVDHVGHHYATPAGFEDQYLGEYDSAEDYAEEYIDSTGALESMPESLRDYFDYEKFARDLNYGGDIHVVDNPSGGVWVFGP